MPEITLAITNNVGLHARPAAQFVQTAKRYSCNLRVLCGERSANAKSILAVLALGAGCGADLTIRAEGADAGAALAALAGLIERNFEELDTGEAKDPRPESGTGT